MNHIKYVNLTNNTLSIQGINILPYGEYVSAVDVTVLDRLDGILVSKYINGYPAINVVEYNSNKVVVSKEKGSGVFIDTSDPQYGWHDLLSPTIVYSGAASNKPTFNTLVGTIKAYQFLLNDESFHEFHIPHDYAPGTDLYIHVHYVHNNATAVTGSTTWQFDATYAKGYERGIFNSPITTTVSQTVSQNLVHQIAEVKLSAVGGTGGLLDTDLIETDGIIRARVALSANSISPVTNPFLLFCDMHYQTTGVPTRNRNYDFWS